VTEIEDYYKKHDLTLQLDISSEVKELVDEVWSQIANDFKTTIMDGLARIVQTNSPCEDPGDDFIYAETCNEKKQITLFMPFATTTSKNMKLFTIAHEFGHVLCFVLHPELENNDDDHEKFADSFAESIGYFRPKRFDARLIDPESVE
jgi:hypothetical protein